MRSDVRSSQADSVPSETVVLGSKKASFGLAKMFVCDFLQHLTEKPELFGQPSIQVRADKKDVISAKSIC